jgi:N,N'-diacetyllegionaminate synthase
MPKVVFIEQFRVNFSYLDELRYDLKRMKFTPEQKKKHKLHCDKVGIEFISSPFSCAAVELLENIGSEV